MKYDVFISYSRKDSQIADCVCKALTKYGLTYFIDKQGIGGGKEFPLVLADAICESAIFLFLASENSNESKFTNSEITFAFNEKPNERIIPYIIDGSKLPRHLRFVFSSITWRTLQEHPIESVLVPDILNLLGKSGITPTNQNLGYEGDADADFNIAYEAWKEEEYDKAFPLFLRLAQSGYQEAYGYVGLCYELGEGVLKDLNHMFSYYKKAIEAHKYLGVYRLGLFYSNNGDYVKAKQLYEKTIEDGWASGDAYYKLGCMHEWGQGGPIDLNKAIEYYRIALQHNYSKREASEALSRLGVFDEVILPDSVLHFTAENLYKLGKQNAEGPDENLSLTFAHYKVAADKGHPFAAKEIVEMNDRHGTPIDDDALVERYKELATKEMIIWVRKNHNFAWDAGYSYHYGVGCYSSIQKAEECYRIGAVNGSASCLWKLGWIEENKGNLTTAFKHYKVAAEKGQGMAMFDLARCYEKGIGTLLDLSKAIQWYQTCSEAPYASASDAKKKYNYLKNKIV